MVSDEAPITRVVDNSGDQSIIRDDRHPVDHQDTLSDTQKSQIDWVRNWYIPIVISGPCKNRSTGEISFPFVYGQVDDELFSHSEWRDCARQALGMRNFSTMVGDFGQHDDSMLVNYGCSRSLPRRGIKARPEQILVTLGAQNALYLISHLLVDAQKRGD